MCDQGQPGLSDPVGLPLTQLPPSRLQCQPYDTYCEWGDRAHWGSNGCFREMEPFGPFSKSIVFLFSPRPAHPGSPLLSPLSRFPFFFLLSLFFISLFLWRRGSRSAARRLSGSIASGDWASVRVGWSGALKEGRGSGHKESKRQNLISIFLTSLRIGEKNTVPAAAQRGALEKKQKKNFKYPDAASVDKCLPLRPVEDARGV